MVAARQPALSWAFQFCRSNARVIELFLRAVFVAFLSAPEVSVSLRKYPINELSLDMETVYANQMARPAKLYLYNHSLYAENARSVQDCNVSHSVLPPDSYE